MSITMKYNNKYDETSCTSGVSRGSMATRTNYNHKAPACYKRRPYVSKWQARKQARRNNLNSDNKPKFMIDNNIGVYEKYNDKTSPYNDMCNKLYPNIKKQYETEKENILNKSKVAKKEKEDYMRHLEKEDAINKNNELSDVKKREKENAKNKMLHYYNMKINNTKGHLNGLLSQYKNGLFKLELNGDYKQLLEHSNPILNQINEYNIKLELSKRFNKDY